MSSTVLLSFLLKQNMPTLFTKIINNKKWIGHDYTDHVLNRRLFRRKEIHNKTQFFFFLRLYIKINLHLSDFFYLLLIL